jgi:hypothetical protein
LRKLFAGGLLPMDILLSRRSPLSGGGLLPGVSSLSYMLFI